MKTVKNAGESWKESSCAWCDKCKKYSDVTQFAVERHLLVCELQCGHTIHESLSKKEQAD